MKVLRRKDYHKPATPSFHLVYKGHKEILEFNIIGGLRMRHYIVIN